MGRARSTGSHAAAGDFSRLWPGEPPLWQQPVHGDRFLERARVVVDREGHFCGGHCGTSTRAGFSRGCAAGLQSQSNCWWWCMLARAYLSCAACSHLRNP